MNEERKNVHIEDTTKNTDEEYERFRRLLTIIFKLCEICGFHLESKIVVRDNKTGKILR